MSRATSSAAGAASFNTVMPVVGYRRFASSSATTLNGWAYYGEQFFGILSRKVIMPLIYCLLIPFEKITKVEVVWRSDPVTRPGLPNLIGVIGQAGSSRRS